ncbi:hypothetical protein CPC08DRAFT_273688 [Agrocybe pediades]|nr:hypothetical protein CPC08DRAFT_273688 [Agrocybe pediades]
MSKVSFPFHFFRYALVISGDPQLGIDWCREMFPSFLLPIIMFICIYHIYLTHFHLSPDHLSYSHPCLRTSRNRPWHQRQAEEEVRDDTRHRTIVTRSSAARRAAGRVWMRVE